MRTPYRYEGYLQKRSGLRRYVSLEALENRKEIYFPYFNVGLEERATAETSVDEFVRPDKRYLFSDLLSLGMTPPPIYISVCG